MVQIGLLISGDRVRVGYVRFCKPTCNHRVWKAAELLSGKLSEMEQPVSAKTSGETVSVALLGANIIGDPEAECRILAPYCRRDGYHFCWKVFKGTTSDKTTAERVIAEMQELSGFTLYPEGKSVCRTMTVGGERAFWRSVPNSSSRTDRTAR